MPFRDRPSLEQNLLINLQMKHRDWLRLKHEGENICAALRQQGYQCCKQTRRLSWRVSQDGISYVLTWLPTPVDDWNLIPNDPSPAREQMWAIVQQALAPNKEESMTLQRPQQAEDYSRPWAIVRLFPDLRRYTVARFFHRQDADDHIRFLNRFIPKAKFEVIFDQPDSKQGDDPA